MRSSRKLILLVNALPRDLKRKYYEACGLVERKLRSQGYDFLNDHQCRYICERLKTGEKLTMTDLRKLSSGKVAPPAPPKTPKQGTLFDS